MSYDSDDELSDTESNIELTDIPPNDPNENDRYYVKWNDSFQDNISIDNQQLRGCTKHKVTLSGISTEAMGYLSAAHFFYATITKRLLQQSPTSSHKQTAPRDERKRVDSWRILWLVGHMAPHVLASWLFSQGFFLNKREEHILESSLSLRSDVRKEIL